MKDETKEILEWLNDKDYYIEDFGYKFKRLSLEENEVLLDYITNLQTIEREYSSLLSENAELENKITNLQEEIRRKDNIIYDLEDFIKEIMKATNKNIISVETAEIIYNKLKELKGEYI